MIANARSKNTFGPADHGRPISDRQAVRARWVEGFRYEIIDGRIYVSPIPDLPHDDLVDWIARPLCKYADAHQDVISQVKTPARVFVPGSTRTTAPEPDLAAYRDYPFHLPIAERRWQDVSPIVVVEVVSGDVAKDLGRNVGLYERVPSIQEYWIVNRWHDDFFFGVFRKRGGRWGKPIDFTIGDTYTTKLLPGFSLRIKPDA